MNEPRVISLMNQGRARLARDEPAAAIAAFSDVIELAPLYPPAYFDRGTARLLANDLDAAIDDLDRAVALLAPGEAQSVAYCNRGIAHEMAGHRDLAIRDLRSALAAGWQPARQELDRIGAAIADNAPDPAAAAARCREGRQLFARAPLDALTRFQQATELAPALQDAWHGLGIVNAALGRNDEAVAAFTRSLAIEPTCLEMRAEALFNRGQLLAQAGDPRARADLAACLALCLDDGVGFPDFGDREKEASFIESLRRAT